MKKADEAKRIRENPGSARTTDLPWNVFGILPK